jgi:hypothetical protein
MTEMEPIAALLAKMDERLARQDEILAQIQATHVTMDAHLMRQTEILAEMYRSEAETKQMVARSM